MHVVLINGPAGAGKNTLANKMRVELHDRIRSQSAVRKLLEADVPRIAIEEHKDPLIHMLFAFAASLSVIELAYDPYDLAEYTRLKGVRMLGRTGREWQITWADAMRAADSNVFIDGLHTKLKNMSATIALVPDCGFVDEYLRAVTRYGERNVTLIYLDEWKPNAPFYSHLDRFNDDIRVCLRDYANLTNPTHVTAVSYVLGRIEENSKQQSLAF